MLNMFLDNLVSICTGTSIRLKVLDPDPNLHKMNADPKHCQTTPFFLVNALSCYCRPSRARIRSILQHCLRTLFTASWYPQLLSWLPIQAEQNTQIAVNYYRYCIIRCRYVTSIQFHPDPVGCSFLPGLEILTRSGADVLLECLMPCIKISVSDPHRFYADPDPTCRI
jgi:hypothetical protein